PRDDRRAVAGSIPDERAARGRVLPTSRAAPPGGRRADRPRPADEPVRAAAGATAPARGGRGVVGGLPRRRAPAGGAPDVGERLPGAAGVERVFVRRVRAVPNALTERRRGFACDRVRLIPPRRRAGTCSASSAPASAAWPSRRSWPTRPGPRPARWPRAR